MYYEYMYVHMICGIDRTGRFYITTYFVLSEIAMDAARPPLLAYTVTTWRDRLYC